MNPTHLYVHVPFCARRCSYCDFAIAVRRNVPVDEYLRCLELEVNQRVANLEGDSLHTVYVGGGTPSRIGPEGIARLLGIVRRNFALADDVEVTVEANPDDVTREAVGAWIAAGVNRVSLGVQSFDDSVLAWMHRTHDSDQAVRAVSTIREAGIGNVSLDLIFALPEALGRVWEADLRAAIDLAPDHISLYGLTIETATPLARWTARGAVIPASEDSYADQFLAAHALATAAGFVHYEVSNFARPGRESRHNSAYWTGAQYLGIGPSAHSFDGQTRSWNVPQYAEWVERLKGGTTPVDGSETLGPTSVCAEKVYLGLRTISGLAASGADMEHARQWRQAGWARIENDIVRLTPEGWLRLDSLAAGLTGL